MITKQNITEVPIYENLIAQEVNKICSEGSMPIPLRRRGKNPNCPEDGFRHLMSLRSPQRVDKGYRVGDVEIVFSEGQLPCVVYPQGMYPQDEWEFENVGIALQASNLWVLDIETSEAYSQLEQFLLLRGIDLVTLQSTYTVVSGSGEGGRHIYFNSPFPTSTVPKCSKVFGDVLVVRHD